MHKERPSLANGVADLPRNNSSIAALRPAMTFAANHATRPQDSPYKYIVTHRHGQQTQPANVVGKDISGSVYNHIGDFFHPFLVQP
jgi:hypothetical protein